jgi:hypothetical protein
MIRSSFPARKWCEIFCWAMEMEMEKGFFPLATDED